jgi:hypothetical protein
VPFIERKVEVAEVKYYQDIKKAKNLGKKAGIPAPELDSE